MSGECQVNVKSQSELDIGGRKTCNHLQEVEQEADDAADPGH